MNSLTKYLVDSILNDDPTENESVFLSKEVIEEWVVSHFPKFISEVSQILGRTESDDGPNFFFPNQSTFEKISKRRAEKIGYTVFKQISDKKFEDYYEHPIYPKGPVKAVTPFPAGVMGKITATNQKDYSTSVAYSKWYKHVTRAMALAGYSIVRSKDEIEKRLATRNAAGSKELVGQKNKLKESVGLAMGYPSKEDLEKKYKELNRLRRKFDKEREMKEELDKGGEPYVVDLEDLTKDNPNYRTTKWTGIDLQMTLMSIEVGGDIGLEIHDDGDQFLRIESGEGKVVMGKDKDNLEFEAEVEDDYAIFIPQGYYHNIINTGEEPLKLYALYAPPEHPTGRVDVEKPVNEMGKSDLGAVERYADSKLDPADVEFTKHFFDRVVDPRNIKPISTAELIGFFKRLADKKKPFMDFLKKYNQFVVTDRRTDINIPFVKQVNQIIAKTIMRKKGFMTSNPKFTVEGLFSSDLKLKPYETLLVKALSQFMQNKLGFSGKIIIKKKNSNSLFGDIVLNDNSLNKGKYYVHFNPNSSWEYALKSLIHELIHAKQIAKGELKPSTDYKELLWKGKPVISVNEYKKFQRKDINQYKNLPWEREAYNGMEPLYKAFLNSKEWKSLVGKDPSLDYILSNLNETIKKVDGKYVVYPKKGGKRLGTHDTLSSAKKQLAAIEISKHEGINEEIKIPVEIGDTILTGRFKNKKVVVKNIGKDEHGMPTINGKKVVTFRVENKPKVNENMKIFIHDTEYKTLLENLLKSNKSVKLLNKLPVNENNSKIEEMYLTTPKDALTELVVWETFKIISESGSFPGVEDVPSGLANAVVSDFLKSFVLPTKAIDPKTVVGIGSTRSILQKLPNAKKVSGDLDLLAVSNGDRKGAVERLKAKAKSMKLAHRVAFGNVFSVAYPYKDKLYQVDLMVAEPSSDNAVYNYMKKFKYWSDEDPIQDTSFLIKGAHRSELAKTIVKAVGLSASESSFTEYIWNDEFSKTQDVAADLEAKASRFRDADKKEQTLAIADILRTKITDMKRLKNLLADEDGFVKNRFPHSIFKNYDKGYGLLLSIVFDKVEEKRNWETILDKKFGITNAIERMSKFEDVMNLIKELLAKKVVTPRAVVNVFKEMKQNFDTGRAAGRWNRALEEYIEQNFPFLKGRW